VFGVVRRYKCTYFSFSYCLSLLSSSDVPYESLKCKMCETLSLPVFYMGVKFRESLLSQGKNNKLEGV
jgi:hypothetical protein